MFTQRVQFLLPEAFVDGDPVRHAFERFGGIAYIFLTHEDDIGDAPRYAKHFGAKRIIHRADADAQPDAEWIVDGLDTVETSPDFRIIPVPGHTDGSMALLYRNRYLFTGDHMAWDREINGLRLATVYVWKESALRRSAERFCARCKPPFALPSMPILVSLLLPSKQDNTCLL